MTYHENCLIPVLLSGGSGTRLWPMSRELMPKQFLPVTGNRSLFQLTLQRLEGLNAANPIIVSNHEHRFLVAEQLREVSVIPNKIILESIARNTAPAVALAALSAVRKEEDPYLLVLPSDHLLEDTKVFLEAISVGMRLAQQDNLVTFGITMTHPETAYGHIQIGKMLIENKAYQIKKFIEKPDLKHAQALFTEQGYLWNSGMFLFKASTYLKELRAYAPTIFDMCSQAFQQSHEDEDFLRVAVEPFAQCPNISIDYAIMEKTQQAVVLPLNVSWSDVGSWASLWAAKSEAHDVNANIKIGDVISDDISNCYIRAEQRLVVAMGIHDCVVVETADAVLVASKEKSQDIKNVVSTLKSLKRVEALTHTQVMRPWGSYEVLMEGTHFKVKRIIVQPHGQLSLQSHQQRAEHWIVVTGTAEVMQDEKVFTLHANQSTYIPAGMKHRLANRAQEPLEIIEIQTGNYLGEDDICRYDDIYGRIVERETL